MGECSRLTKFLMVSAMVSLCSCAGDDKEKSGGKSSADPETVSSLVASEELILELTPRLKSFKDALFTENCHFVGVDPGPVQKKKYPGLGTVETHWKQLDNNEPVVGKPTIEKSPGPRVN